MIIRGNRMTGEPEKSMWIGLFRVTGPPDNVHLQGCPGAYVTVLGCARNETTFRHRVSDGVVTIGLTLDEVVWTELLSERLERFAVEEYLLGLAAEADRTGELRFGIFHAWEGEE